jgi:hypothetical protein
MENNYQIKKNYYEKLNKPRDNKGSKCDANCTKSESESESMSSDPSNDASDDSYERKAELPNNMTNDDESGDDSDDDSMIQMIRKFYKYLSILIHPDKHADQIDKYTKLFQQLSEFMKQNNLQGMIDIANSEGLDISSFTNLNEFIGSGLDAKIESLRFEIILIKKRVYWRWFFEKDPQKRLELIEHYFEKIKKPINN